MHLFASVMQLVMHASRFGSTAKNRARHSATQDRRLASHTVCAIVRVGSNTTMIIIKVAQSRSRAAERRGSVDLEYIRPCSPDSWLFVIFGSASLTWSAERQCSPSTASRDEEGAAGGNTHPKEDRPGTASTGASGHATRAGWRVNTALEQGGLFNVVELSQARRRPPSRVCAAAE